MVASSFQELVGHLRAGLSNSIVRLLVSLVAGGLSLYLVLDGIDLSLLVAALGRADPVWLVAGGVVVLAVEAVKGMRWRLLFSPDEIPYWRALSALLIGRLWNNVIPVRAGDLVRAYLVVDRTPLSKFQALGTVAIEKVFDGIVLLAFLVALLAAFALPSWLKLSGLLVSTLAVPSLGALVLASHHTEQVLFRLRLQSHKSALARRLDLLGRMERAILALRALRDARLIGAVGALSALAWGLGCLTNHLVLNAVGLPLPVTASLAVLIAGYVGGTIPSPPGRIGVFEYTVIISLSPFGVDRELALVYAVLLHAVVLLPASLIAALLLMAGAGHPRNVGREGS